MRYLEKEYNDVKIWNNTHGLPMEIDRQRFFVESESKEFQEATGEERLIELGDWFFVSAGLKEICKANGTEFHTSYIDCLNIVRELEAEKYVRATIKSNWTKFAHKSDTTLEAMAKEAVACFQKYKGRYTQVVPVLAGDYYFLKGLEGGVEKVLKPSTFRSAKEFL